MSSTGLWPWPDPNNHEIQMLRSKCRELEAANKAQAEQIKRLQRALSLNVIRGGPSPLTRFEYMYERGELLPSDMEATDE